RRWDVVVRLRGKALAFHSVHECFEDLIARRFGLQRDAAAVVLAAADLDQEARFAVLFLRRHPFEGGAVRSDQVRVERRVLEEKLAVLGVAARGVAVEAGPLADFGPDLVLEKGVARGVVGPDRQLRPDGRRRGIRRAQAEGGVLLLGGEEGKRCIDEKQGCNAPNGHSNLHGSPGESPPQSLYALTIAKVAKMWRFK